MDSLGSLTDGLAGRVLSCERAALEPVSLRGRGSGTPAAGSPLRQVAMVAVRPADGPSGVLSAWFSTLPQDPVETLRVLTAYGRLATLCLEVPGLLDGMLEHHQNDGLTGALTHTALCHQLDCEVRRSQRHRLSLSCCFIDLDRFKLINERFGHLYGSRMLTEVAVRLRAGLRREDTLGRYGGDEFVAILPETAETAALAIATRLRATIAGTAARGAHSPIDASIGVAQWQPGSSAEQLLETSDRALHAAKAAGGGMVIGASSLARATNKSARSRGHAHASAARDRHAVRFCAHCGRRPPAGCDRNVRVCERCGLGILIWASPESAPSATEPFVIVDERLTVHALSKHAEPLMGLTERWAVDRRIDELLTDDPEHDTEDPKVPDLHGAITQAIQGGAAPIRIELRPTKAPHTHLPARIGACGPPRAALVVLESPS